jgi:hypothetical protein
VRDLAAFGAAAVLLDFIYAGVMLRYDVIARESPSDV